MAILTAAGDAGLPLTSTSVAPFTWAGYTVEAVPSLARLDAEWRALETLETASMFQGRDYTAAWLRTSAAACGEEPVFVTARLHDALAFILPMALTRRAGVRVLTWLGQSHSNYGMGVFHPEALAASARDDWDIDQLVCDLARRLGADLVHLDHQPAQWKGQANPFIASMRSLRTANDTFVVPLDEDFAAHYKRLFSSRTLSGLKRKQRKLEDMGKVSFARPQDEARSSDVLGWFFAQKKLQLEQSGRTSPFDAPHIQALYLGLARSTDTFDIDELMVDTTRVAMGMTAHAGRTAYLLNTVHQGAEFARCSPGALLLHRMVAQAHAAGARTYDFGPGELPYKLEWEPEVVPLFSSTHLIHPRAILVYAAYVFGGLAKAKIKRSPTMSEWVRKLRAFNGKS